ncbi:MAG TPA: DUF72 domain-containing protein, partial [Vicinamibacterales bacterium]|nr:DUF72 domain-containing protein [Vicinamibacterales bacterium]
MPMAELRIGTSGWNYPSGRGTWNGVFYPPTRGRAKTFDELSYYAEHFNTVEVNSTFYGQPRAEVCRAWAHRTPSTFEFAVKLYQKFTHPRMYKKQFTKASGGHDPAVDDLLLDALTTPNPSDLDEFRRGIEPLASTHRLGPLLAQFPPSFKRDDASAEYLDWLLHSFNDYAVAVELRHRSWSDALGETLSLLNAHGAAFVQIDEPKFRLSIAQNQLPNIPTFYYMRLHGRNAAQWWSHAASEDRYNYLYSERELQEFVGTIDAARSIVRKAYLYTNNHFSAKSIANAAMIKKQ